jgi:hypothetical protein
VSVLAPEKKSKEQAQAHNNKHANNNNKHN